MASVSVYSLDGKKSGSLELNDAVFSVQPNAGLVQKVAVVEAGNARWSTAHTKDRSEVRGGGRKPWKQKGTGRARAGSSRSPIWRAGGVTFGPTKDRNFNRSTNTTEKHVALRSVLTDRVRKEALVVVDGWNLKKPSTKTVSAALNALPTPERGKVLVLTADSDEHLFRSARNIEGVTVVRAQDASVLPMTRTASIVLSKEAVEVLQNRLAPVSN